MGSWSRKHSLTWKKHLESNSVWADFLYSFQEKRGKLIAEHNLLNFIAVTKDNTFTITVSRSLKNKFFLFHYFKKEISLNPEKWEEVDFVCRLGGNFYSLIFWGVFLFAVVGVFFLLNKLCFYLSTERLETEFICRNKNMSDPSSHRSSGCFALCSLWCTHGRARDGNYRGSVWDQGTGHPNCSCSITDYYFANTAKN